jgi:hypothetical protein
MFPFGEIGASATRNADDRSERIGMPMRTEAVEKRPFLSFGLSEGLQGLLLDEPLSTDATAG